MDQRGQSRRAQWPIAHGFPKDGLFASEIQGQRIGIVPSKHLAIARFGCSQRPDFVLEDDFYLMTNLRQPALHNPINTGASAQYEFLRVDVITSFANRSPSLGNTLFSRNIKNCLMFRREDGDPKGEVPWSKPSSSDGREIAAATSP
jgi:hypothetical protein